MDKKLSNTMLLILETLLSSINSYTYPRKLSSMLGISHRAASINLKKLAEFGVLVESKIGKENQYRINLESPTTLHFLSFAEYIKLLKTLDKLPTKVRKVILEMQRSLLDEYPASLLSCMIFGSYAKGYYTKKSDIHTLLIVRSTNTNFGENLSKISKAWGIIISSIHLTLEDFQKNLEKRNPTMMEVLENHLILLGAENFWSGVAKWKKA